LKLKGQSQLDFFVIAWKVLAKKSFEMRCFERKEVCKACLIKLFVY
jgi:hypothetical protein